MDPNTGNTYGPDEELPPDVAVKDLVELSPDDFEKLREERQEDVRKAIERRNARKTSRAEQLPPPRNYGRRGQR